MLNGMGNSEQVVHLRDATAPPRHRAERRVGFSLRRTPLPARSSHPATCPFPTTARLDVFPAPLMAPTVRLRLPATRLTHLSVWLTTPSARSVPPARRLTVLSTRLELPTVWLVHPTARLDVPTAPINQLSIRLKEPATPVNRPATPINHLLVPVNRPAARFFAKNTPKPAKTAPFPRPAMPTGQKTTVCAGVRPSPGAAMRSLPTRSKTPCRRSIPRCCVRGRTHSALFVYSAVQPSTKNKP